MAEQTVMQRWQRVLGRLGPLLIALLGAWWLVVQPALQRLAQETENPRCAVLFEDQNGDGQFDPTTEPLLDDLPGAEIELVTSEGVSLGRFSLESCRLPPEADGRQLRLILYPPPGWRAVRLEQEVQVAAVAEYQAVYFGLTW